MKRSGVADLPLHGGRVPPWLAERMTKLGSAIAESILYHYGTSELLSRLSDPFWFQALGSVMGMDWAFIRHHDFGARRAQARVESAGTRARHIDLRWPGKAFPQYSR